MHFSALLGIFLLFNPAHALPEPRNTLAKRIPSAVWGPGAFRFSAAGTPIIVLDGGVQTSFQIADSNFVVYKNNIPQWNSQAVQPAGCSLNDCLIVFQEDGNLVVYFDGVAIWASNTGAGQGAWLVFFDIEPYIVIYGHDLKPIWHTPITPPAAPPVPHRASQRVSPLPPFEYTYTIEF